MLVGLAYTAQFFANCHNLYQIAPIYCSLFRPFKNGVMLPFDLYFVNALMLRFEISAHKIYLNDLVVTKNRTYLHEWSLNFRVFVSLPYF